MSSIIDNLAFILTCFQSPAVQQCVLEKVTFDFICRTKWEHNMLQFFPLTNKCTFLGKNEHVNDSGR